MQPITTAPSEFTQLDTPLLPNSTALKPESAKQTNSKWTLISTALLGVVVVLEIAATRLSDGWFTFMLQGPPPWYPMSPVQVGPFRLCIGILNKCVPLDSECSVPWISFSSTFHNVPDCSELMAARATLLIGLIFAGLTSILSAIAVTYPTKFTKYFNLVIITFHLIILLALISSFSIILDVVYNGTYQYQPSSSTLGVSFILTVVSASLAFGSFIFFLVNLCRSSCKILNTTDRTSVIIPEYHPHEGVQLVPVYFQSAQHAPNPYGYSDMSIPHQQPNLQTVTATAPPSSIYPSAVSESSTGALGNQ